MGCSSFKPTRIDRKKTICSKEVAISKAKNLLSTDDLYLFDCDFSRIESITIKNISYNLCVSGYILSKDKEESIDMEQQAIIYIVSNYSIESNDKCFGFSIIASVLIPKMDHYVNNEFSYTNPNKIYTKETYSSIKDLHNNGETTYGGNICVAEIEIPKDFYTLDFLQNAVSVKSSYLKIEGDINSSGPIKVIDTPVSIITHYKNYEDKNSMLDNSTTKKLIKYFTDNAIYTKF